MSGSADLAAAPGAAGSSQALAALQNALAAEQAASYGYGVVGGRLPQRSSAQAAAATDWLEHVRARDGLTQLIHSRGATPRPTAVAYRLPFPVNSPADAKALAATLEDRVAAAYLGLVALTDAALRSFGAEQVRAAALRAEAWRGTTLAFPGLPADSLHH